MNPVPATAAVLLDIIGGKQPAGVTIRKDHKGHKDRKWNLLKMFQSLALLAALPPTLT